MNPCTIIFGKNNQINSFCYLLIDLIIEMGRMEQTRLNQIEMNRIDQNEPKYYANVAQKVRINNKLYASTFRYYIKYGFICSQICTNYSITKNNQDFVYYIVHVKLTNYDTL